MSSDVAVRIESLGKSYMIRHQQSDHVTLAQVALERVRHPLRRSAKEDFWALRDVSFEVRHGEVLGVIGRNGAGKSTLLKLLTRITAPTAGRIDLWGRIGSLLEVGTGFHPELTGRENIYLNGSILGMSRREIDRQFDAIVDFAGVEKFLDTPVKRYSSGMYVRLAFAVAAHLETEILLLDEVLAVGDGDFQEKCFRKVNSLASGGRTVILVSHNLAAVKQFCDRAILLESGSVVADGGTTEVLERYQAEATERADFDVAAVPRTYRRWGSEARIAGVTINAGSPLIGSGEPLRVRIEVSATKGFTDQFLLLQIRSLAGEPVASAFSDTPFELQSGINSIDAVIPEPALISGRYSLGVAIGTGNLFAGTEELDNVPDAAAFLVGPNVDDQGRTAHWHPTWGSLRYRRVEVALSDEEAGTAIVPSSNGEPKPSK